MKALKAVALTLAVVVGGFTAIGLVLPRDMKAERSVAIEAPRAAVYAKLSDVSSWNGWIVGSTIDPRCRFTPQSKQLAWDCEGAKGSLSIVDEDAPNAMWIDAVMPGAVGRAKIKVTLEDAASATKVTWLEEARAPGLVGGWLTPLFRRARGEQIEIALKQLQRTLEPPK